MLYVLAFFFPPLAVLLLKQTRHLIITFALHLIGFLLFKLPPARELLVKFVVAVSPVSGYSNAAEMVNGLVVVVLIFVTAWFPAAIYAWSVVAAEERKKAELRLLSQVEDIALHVKGE